MEPRTVLISGGSKGLGLSMSEALLRAGYRVRAFSRNASAGTRALEAEHGPEGRYAWTALDALDRDGLHAYVQRVHKEDGHIYGLINNAGVHLDRLLPVTTYEEIGRLLALNLESLMLLTRLVTRVMIQRGDGSIINVSSIIGHRGIKGTSVYSATKAGVLGFTRSLARELGSRRIRVNALLPGYVETDMTEGMAPAKKEQVVRRTPLGRLGRVGDIASVAEFLLSPGSAFITGQSIVVDGGLTC